MQNRELDFGQETPTTTPTAPARKLLPMRTGPFKTGAELIGPETERVLRSIVPGRKPAIEAKPAIEELVSAHPPEQPALAPVALLSRPKLLTVKEAAVFLTLSVSTLNKWRCAGKGPQFLKIGRYIKYDEEVLRSFLDSCVQERTAS